MTELALASRYAFLLQPVRDLAKNWDVNIEAFLAECIESAQQEVEADAEGQHFNFAEAGLLIQSTSDVYCRKVEYVYGLAVGFSDHIRQKQSKNKNITRRTCSDAVEDEEAEDDCDDVDAEEAFETRRCLDDPCVLIDFTDLRPDQPSVLSLESESIIPHTLPVLPMSLMTVAEFEKINVALYARRNRQQLIGQKDDFKINTGFIHRSGALLLDLVNEELLGQYGAAHMTAAEITEATVVAEGANDERSLMGELRATIASVHKMPPPAENEREGCRSSAVVENERRTAASCVASNCAAERSSGQVTGLLTNSMSEKELIAMNTAGGDGLLDDDDEFCDDEVFDERPLLEELDIVRSDRYQNAPFKKVKAYIPIGQRLKKRSSEYQRMGIPAKTSIFEYIHDSMYRKHRVQQCMQRDGALSEHFLVTISGFLEDKRKNRASLAAFENVANCGKKSDAAREEAGKEVAAVDELDAMSDDEEDAGGFGSDGEVDVELAKADADGTGPQSNKVDQNYANEFKNGKRPCCPYCRRRNADASLTFTSMVAKFSIISAKLDKPFHSLRYWTAIEQSGSELRQRVQKWEATMLPILQEEERRRQFNIHEYGSEILNNFREIGQTISFAEVVSEKQWYECSRYLLSMLVLANTGNLLLKAGNREDAFAGLECTLLKRERHHEVFDDAETLF
ncbi:Condensin-2 complex subunit H2 [Toxocara canis]|uniref:Condensin-2 complex subunit H2 n=1 Tax=Toxocara canis TaxID=6265 RepID=A0A0B2VQY1_TOXCA|nr:Condensin-2 complex subunit H2 [Toxocara canis]